MSKFDKKEAAKKRQEGLNEILDKLENGIKGLLNSENYKAYLTCMSKFHNYSFNNTILIALQKPDATLVAGFKSWETNFKRRVRKGEKGIKIIAPAPIKVKNQVALVDDKGNPFVGLDGKQVTEEVEVTIPKFKVINVFDVSQTEGEPLPSIGVDELAGKVDKYDELIEALEHISPVEVRYIEMEHETKGYFSHPEQMICVKEDMSQVQTLKTLIHEISHALLHDREHVRVEGLGVTADKNRNTKEIEAESVAFTVCEALGKGTIDTSDYSFAYIAGWSQDKDLSQLKKSLETIRVTADKIITSVEEYIDARNLQKEEIKKMADKIADEKYEPFKEKINKAKEELKNGNREGKTAIRNKDSNEIHTSRAKSDLYL